ncbi:dihydropyrimidinase [Anatilimnocola sp. NA78]|uniref:dihydropyrimidinase n=1 Tax=Anatilimnocola sp. NA78 TaxID=3415683 RepID=UPI003CE46E23
MKNLIKNGRIITATDDYFADVYIDGETVSCIGKNLPMPADKTIDAQGKLVIPGGIDPHVHMQLPFGGTVSSDDFRSGTLAAAFGGTTSIIDFAIQYKGKTFQQTIDDWDAKSEGKCAIDYSYHLAITEYEPRHQPEFKQIIDAGITTFKLFMAYPGVFMIDDQTMFRVMQSAGEAGGLTLVHAENGDAITQLINNLLAQGKVEPKYHAQSRPPTMQADGVARAVRVAEVAKAPVFIVHVSCEAAMKELQRSRDEGHPAYGETCTQYLFLDETYYDKPNFEGAKYVFTPPLVGKENIEPLWKGLKLGYLQEVSTDHCPFNFKGQKELGRGDFTKIPNGGPGVEDRLSLVYDGAVVKRGFSLNKWVEITSTASAKMFGMFPKKGTIAVGSDADIVLFNPDIERTISAQTHHMNCDYSLFEGWKIKGQPETVLSRGKVIIENGQYVGKAGDGKFLKRGQCAAM